MTGNGALDSYDVRSYLGPQFLGRAINPLVDPWYRFGRILLELDATLSVERGAHWVDLGCHQGQFVRLVVAKYGVRGTGVDEWDPASKDDSSWQYYRRDLGREIAIDERCSYLSALEVLEHIIDTDAFLERCRDQLNDGGHFVLSTPNINSLRNRVMVPLGAYPVGLEYRNVIHHVRLYNVSLLRAHLEQHGFRVLWARGVNFVPARVIERGFRPALDRPAANRAPQLCNNVIVLAQKR